MLLSARQICKSFGRNLVLNRVDFEVARGEVHALMGENGAGKSTLVKILSGVYAADRGEVYMEGRPVRLARPVDALAHGLATVYQELNLATHLTVAENIFLGREPLRLRRAGVIDRGRLYADAQAVIDRFGFAMDARAPVRSLSLAQRQLVEIARAVVAAGKLVVMDEPTSSLTEGEVVKLFAVIRELRAHGLSIVYISHRIQELQEIADRVTVLRDGVRVLTGPFREFDTPTLLRQMVGRELRDIYPPKSPPGWEEVLRVNGLRVPGRLEQVDLTLRRGEILGLAGLAGSGVMDIVRALYGVAPRSGGTLLLGGRALERQTPERAVRQRMGFLTEDRKATGICPELSVKFNMSLASLRALVRWGVINLKKEEAAAAHQIESLRIRPPDPRQRIGRLSGGNQQKAVLARWLMAESQVLLCAEPTRGIDMGARAEIYRLLAGLAGRGVSIVIVSSDLPELLGLCHEIIVIRRGRSVKRLRAENTSQEEILHLAAIGE